MIPIVYTRWGLANRFDDSIELNENLKSSPELQAQLLAHELKHTDKKFTIEDLKHDLLSQQEIDYKKLIMFMLKHPRTLIQLLPLYWSPKRRQVIYDLNLIIIYGIFFCIIILGTLMSLSFL